MKKIKFLVLLIMFFLTTAVNAAEKTAVVRPSGTRDSGDTGLGIMLGEPTGLTFKSWLSHTQAFDLGLSYSFSNYFEILGDYLWHFPKTFEGKYGDEFVPYVGVGGALFFNTASVADKAGRFSSGSVGFGVRVPLGLEFLPHTAPIGVFVELAPGIGLAPSTYAFLQGDIGIRFYF